MENKHSEEELKRFAELINEYIESNLVKVYDQGNFAAAALHAFESMNTDKYEEFEQRIHEES